MQTWGFDVCCDGITLTREHMERKRQEELQRQQLEKLLSMERPPMGPAMDGVLWSRCQPSEMCDMPVLSILKLELRQGMDIQDATGALCKLWAAVLRYIRSMPGCVFLRWGVTRPDGNTIFCFIQWKSSAAWHEFQKSPGFQPMTAFLASNVWNRHVKLGAPAIAAATQWTRVVTISFDAFVDGDEKKEFHQEFCSRFDSTSLCSGWLEHNAVVFAEHTEAQAATARTPTIFFSLLDKNGSSPEHFRDDVDFATISGIERETHSHLIRFTEDAATAGPVVPLHNSPGDTIAWICDTDLLQHTAAAIALPSSENTQNTRFPGPRASECSQGDLNEDGELPELPALSPPPHNSLLKVAWIRLHEISSAEAVHEALHHPLSKLKGYQMGTWALDHERDLVVAIITMWRFDEDEASRERYHATLKSLVRASPQVDQTWVLEHRSMPASVWMHEYTCMEINTFHVPNDPGYQGLFTSAVSRWKSSMVANRQRSQHNAGACDEEAVGGWDPAVDENEMLRYTCVVRWESPTARREWYARLYDAPYASFGLNLDALKIGASGGIQTQLLQFQSNYQMAEDSGAGVFLGELMNALPLGHSISARSPVPAATHTTARLASRCAPPRMQFFFPRADASLLTPSPDAIADVPPPRPTTVGPVFDAENVGRPVEPWVPELAKCIYPPKLDPYAVSSVPEETAVPLDCRYLRARLAKNERLRLSMLWYYGRHLEEEPELLAGLQEKACLAQESSGWEFAVIGLLDVNVYVRLVTVGGLELGILPRGETICAHTVTQPPGSVFLLPSLQEDWRFRDCPYAEKGGLAAYAGIPLRMQHESGECVGLGSICVASATSQPPLSQQQQQTLTRLADWVVADIVQCTRTQRQRERRRLAELVESVENGSGFQDSHAAVLGILQDAYPGEVIRIQPSDADRCDVNWPEVLPPGLKNGLWEDTAYIDEIIATSNQNETPTDRVVRLMSSQCDTELGHSLLVVGTKDFRRIFDDVDAWFIQTCANLATRVWQKRLLTEAIKAKENFLRGVSHQLRTPIHGILGAAELLSEELRAISLSEMSRSALIDAESAPIAGKTSLYLDTISGAGRELMSTVNSMITLNRWADIALAERRYAMHDVGDLEGALLKQVLEASVSQTGMNASVFCHCEVPTGKLLTDMNLLRDSIWPLVHNAIQNTPEGVVTIKFSMRPGTETFMVDVEDTGRGIPPQDQERVFQLYEKVDEHSTGAGLGLTIAVKFAALLHGSVELVSSRVGHGTHFRATFDDMIHAVSANPPVAAPAASFKHLPPNYDNLDKNSSCRTLSSNFAEFLTRMGFASDRSADCFTIFEYSSDIEKLRARTAVLLEQVAICLVPQSVDAGSLESLPRVVYATPPFSSLRLVSALQMADEMSAMLRSSKAVETDPVNEKKGLGGLASPSTIDEGYNSMDGSSPLPRSDQSSQVELGRETSNSFFSPTCESSAGSASQSAPPRPPTRSAAPMVLVVDDNLVNLGILQMYCKKRGLPFLSATDGKQAVDVFSKHKASPAASDAPIELVLMDLQMPVCDGLDATAQIRALEQDNAWAASVVLMITGQDSQADRQAASAVGADDYMVKPIGIARLDAKLKRYFPLFKTQSAR
ncbi:CheY-like superfamily [Cordyceps fumosorosea ARSEF 2679]|uniref:histidine kinase n=1 Tax=Cordyceps fumosorosea (strain ARSEF 2679) TaxID=1081104 RepID=A0A167LVN2_CORFA|nr:CheY-like superfamily [Cordyceps fumosorosea ARSEF 2679]OAA53573.1 CheY-like superfamily [Cordyceps fumosorosea ARSEF 2679]